MTPQRPETSAPEPSAWLLTYRDSDERDHVEGVTVSHEWANACHDPEARKVVVPLYTLDTALAAARERIVGELEAEAARCAKRGRLISEESFRRSAKFVRQGGSDE
jgi:hypothetical protein